MSRDKAKTMYLGFPGVICLHEDLEGRLTILDGQHRIGMMQALRERQNKVSAVGRRQKEDDYFNNVLVEVYTQPPDQSPETTQRHAEEVFSEINKAEPIKLVDMPGVATESESETITGAVLQLKADFPKMFSAYHRCRSPNVNVDNMRNMIFGSNVLQRRRLRNSKQLYDFLVDQNEALRVKYQSDLGATALIPWRAMEKANDFGFYLGIERSWLYV